MSKKSPIRASRQAIAQHPMQLKKITELMLASAILSVAAVSAQAQTANAVLVDSNTSFGGLNGALSTGGQAAGYVITGGASVQVGNNDTQSLVSNFNTIGGAGSGGGAALGGAFFVDSGASLTVLNTDFSSNRAQGGTGGGVAPVSYVDQLFNITGAALNLNALPVATVSVFETNNVPLITRSLNSGVPSYSFNTLSINSDTATVLKPGYVAAFDNYGTSVAIGNINGGTIQLNSAVTAVAKSLPTYQSTAFNVSPETYNSQIETAYARNTDGDSNNNMIWPTVPAVDQAGQSGYTLSNGTVTLNYAFTLKAFQQKNSSNGNNTYITYSRRAVDLPELSNVNVGDKLVTGTTTPQLSTITEVVRYTQAEDAALDAGGSLMGKVKSFTLDRAIVGTPAFVDVMPAPTFKALAFTANGANVTVAGTGALLPGMTATWTENNVAKSAVVQSVNGRTVTLSGTVASNVTDLKLVENPLVGDNALRVPNAAGKFLAGQAVYVPGNDGTVYQGTVYSVVGDLVTVTPSTSGQKLSDYYDPAAGLALKTAAAIKSGSNLTVPYSAAGKTDAQIVALLNGRIVSGSSFADNTKVNSVQLNKTNGVVTSVTLGLSAAATTASVESFKLLSPMSYGGNMNNLATPNSSSTASSGFNANHSDSFFNDSEGVSGTNGREAAESSGGRGNNGGAGGSGSMGLPVNFWLMYDVASAATSVVMSSLGLYAAVGDLTVAGIELTSATLDLVGVSTPDPQAGLGVTLPDPIEIAAKTMEVSNKTIGLTNANIGLVDAITGLGFSIADLVLATTQLTNWGINLNRGLAGLGGSGGDGGSGSSGTDFFGGGIGGGGGAGGAGALSFSDGGNGGAGGSGGAGGFGAGGGAGGAGGAAGANGNALGGDAGGGGTAGFGAGSGADGNGEYGSGGSGLGGSIFVRAGGSLLIKGESHFLNSYVAGGSTASTFGAAGSSAGSDMFIMKGSSVRLQPGAGNTIQFDGTIADDSAATDGSYQYAAGDGADLRIGGGVSAGGGGLVVFNGANTYSGQTILEGATLSAFVGVGVNDLSLIRFNGQGSVGVDFAHNKVNSTLSLDTVGTFLLQEDFIRRAGTFPGETAWTGSGGFASGMPSGVQVTLGATNSSGAGQQLTWGRDGFFTSYADSTVGSDGVLTFGSEYSNAAVKFTNNVALNNNVARVAVFNTGNLSTSQATLSGNWTNAATGSTLMVGDSGAYNGLLFMTGQNSLDNVVVAGGTLSTFNAEGAAGKLFKDTSNLVVLSNTDSNNVATGTSRLQLFSNERLNNVSLLLGSSLTLTQGLSVLGSLTNLGEINILGRNFGGLLAAAGPVDAAGELSRLGLTYLPTSFSPWNGSLSVAGTFTNTGAGSLNQSGDISLGVLDNRGQWTAHGNITVANSITNTGSMNVHGDVSTTTGSTGDVQNDNSWVQVGNLTVRGSLSNTAPTGVMTVTGNTEVTLDLVNQKTMALDGTLDVLRNLGNSGTLGVTGNTDVTGYVLNTATGLMTVAADLAIGDYLQNNGRMAVTGAASVGTNLGNSTDAVLTAASLSVGGNLVNAGAASILGGASVTGAASNSGSLSVGGASAVTGNLSNANTGTWHVGGNSSVTGSVDNAGTATVYGNSTVGTYLNNTGVLTVNGNSTVNTDFSNAGTVTLKRGSTVLGDLTNTGRMSVGTVERVGMVVGGNFHNNGIDSYFALLGDSTVTGNMTNDGSMSLTGVVNVTGDFRNNKTATITGNTFVRDFTNAQSLALQGNLTARNYTNNVNSTLSIVGDATVAGNTSNSGVLLQTGNLTTTQTLVNHGFWNFGSNATVQANALGGTGAFCLSSSTNSDCTGGDAAQVTFDLATNSRFDGFFKGTGGLTKTGAGGLLLTQNQTFSGGLTVNNGTVIAMATMSDDLDIVVGPNGTYEVGTADTVRSFVNNAPHSVVLNADLTTTAGFANNGRLAVNGDLVVNGNVQRYVRVLNMASAGLTGSVDGNVVFNNDNATNLRLIQNGNSTYSGSFSRGNNESHLVKEGTGTLTASGPINLRYVTIAAGGLALNGANILSSDAIVDVRQDATLSLLVGNQSIDQLLGAGIVNLGENVLSLTSGGNFTGTVLGSGRIDVAAGNFAVNGIINSPTANFRINSDTTTLANTGVLNVNTLDVAQDGTLRLGDRGQPVGATVNASSVTIAGVLEGSGTINGATIVTSTGHLSPGYSPGAVVFNDGLTLESLSLTTMEIENKLLTIVGEGWDNIALGNGKALTIQSGAQLEIKEFGAFRDGGLLMGEKLNLFAFTPGKVNGVFGNAFMSTATVNGSSEIIANPHVVMNLATGNVVGLGESTLAVVASKAQTGNERAIYQGLLKSSTGGVGQFYGGRFVENLTSAVANNTGTRAVFNAYSPEVYMALSDVSQDAAQAAMPSWKSSYLGQTGFMAFSAKSSKSSRAGEDQQSYGVGFNQMNVGYVRPLGNKALMFTFGDLSSVRADSKLFNGTGKGYNASASLLGRFEGLSDTAWHVGLGLSTTEMSGSRDILTSRASFTDIGARSTVLSSGIETKKAFGVDSYFMGRGALSVGSTRRDGITETGGSLGGLDVMTLQATTRKYSLFDAGFEVGTRVSPSTMWYGSFDVQTGSVNKSVIASFDNGQASVDVNANSALRATSKVMTGLRFRGKDGMTFDASLGGTHSWDSKTNVLARVNVFVPF